MMDEAQLNEYFEKLSEEHPELIQTQHVDKVVMFDIGVEDSGLGADAGFGDAGLGNADLGDVGDALEAKPDPSPQFDKPYVKIPLSKENAGDTPEGKPDPPPQFDKPYVKIPLSKEDGNDAPERKPDPSPQVNEPCVKIPLSKEEADVICRNNAELNYVKNQIWAANQTLRRISQNLGKLEKVLHGLVYVGILGFGVVMIFPFLSTNVIVEDPPEPEEVELTMYEKFAGALRGAYDWCIHSIY